MILHLLMLSLGEIRRHPSPEQSILLFIAHVIKRELYTTSKGFFGAFPTYLLLYWSASGIEGANHLC